MSNLISLLDRPIAYQACFVRFGGVTGAVLLSQLVYWHNRMDGSWFYKTQKEIKSETGLSREEQETARRRLISAGVLEEDRRGVPAKLFFRVKADRLEALLLKSEGKPQSSMRDSRIQESGISTDKNADMPQASLRETHSPACGKAAFIHTVDYQETTTEITTESSCQVAAQPDPAVQITDMAKQVLKHLNMTTGAKFQTCRSSLENIKARISEGYELSELLLVVDYKHEHWKDTEQEQYLRPATLFIPKNFPGYLQSATKWNKSGRPKCVNGKWVRDVMAIPSTDYAIPDGFRGA
ncbi:conserved phage C-terminal domain-containing protein [Pantoea stewartii subsp. indologenes]|uniref:conserved phage C-terminal domain-containing protein n=1 Tax=Pantoea stewartii TaxID=66269 RepID=UPI0024DF3F6A|nr:conserved phage C-terminal domain-containing protein [Pantoea stewartii]MDK2631969.1 conserved phage C-terminal domain-containing protein [Pantoea stewartii subsp. indologenes]